jgi:hypothetical protein
MTDQHLDQLSRRLLDAVGDVQELEHQKRATARSTPEFHELADQIENKTRQVFAVAVEQRELGEDDSPIPAEQAEQHPGDWTDGDIDGRNGEGDRR